MGSKIALGVAFALYALIWVCIVATFVGCSTVPFTIPPASVGASPSEANAQCPEPPEKFLNINMLKCDKATGGATCCGYGFLNTSSQLCFHFICQLQPCAEWMYYSTECQPVPQATSDTSIRN